MCAAKVEQGDVQPAAKEDGILALGRAQIGQYSLREEVVRIWRRRTGERKWKRLRKRISLPTVSGQGRWPGAFMHASGDRDNLSHVSPVALRRPGSGGKGPSGAISETGSGESSQSAK